MSARRLGASRCGRSAARRRLPGRCVCRRRRGQHADRLLLRPSRRPPRPAAIPISRSQFTVENRIAPAKPERLQLRGRQRRHRPHSRPASSAIPHATPQCSIADFAADDCPIDSQVGIVNVVATGGLDVQRRGLQPRSRRPMSPACSASRSSLGDTPQFTVLSARTGSDYGLDATATSIFHGLAFRLRPSQQVLWGVPADPIHDPLRLNPSVNPKAPGSPATSATSAMPNGAAQHQRSEHRTQTVRLANFPPAASNSPLTPFLQNPTNCDAPAQRLARRPLLRRRHRPRRLPLAADDRLRSAQLQPEPLRAADHRPRPTPPRASTSTSPCPSS